MMIVCARMVVVLEMALHNGLAARGKSRCDIFLD
jgi:hypothetical protein